MIRRLAPLLFVPVLSLCGESTSDPVICTEEARPGVVIDAVRANNGARVTQGLSGDLVDGTYREALAVILENGTLFGATEREGDYTATVRATGFSTMVIEDLHVRGDQCHVITIRVTARLEET